MNLLIFDSSAVINFAMNGILDILENLKKVFPGKLIITPAVKREIIDRPRQIKKFELGALKIKNLLNISVLEMPDSLRISNQEIERKTREILFLANHTYASKGQWMQIIHEGEASCLALSLLSSRQGIKNLLVIDERTTRMLCEKPENLAKLFESKIHIRINYNPKNASLFREIRIIRSAELIYIAYKKNLVSIKDPDILDALLYGVKFKGCAISKEEIMEIKHLR